MAEESQGTTAEATPEGAAELPKAKEKLQQSVEIRDVGPCRKHIKVTVDRNNIDKLLADKYKQLVGDSWVPGFRPGKAPRQIVVRRYQKEVHDQIKGELLLASLEQLADDHDVAPLAPPNLNPNRLQIPEQGPFVYEFEVEVRPEFDLPTYKGLKLKRPVKEFTDADVAAEEQRLFSRFGQLIPKDGPAEKGDYLIVDMTSTVEGQTIGTTKEVTLRIDDTLTFKDAVAPHFAEQTVGVKAGETRAIDLTMTDAVGQEGLKGKTAQTTLEVKDVKKLRLPELNEEFLAQFGVQSVEQLREQLRVMLDRRLEYTQRQSAREQVLELISAAANWQLPQDLLQRQARKTMARRVLEMRESGMPEEEIEARQRLLQRDVLANTAKALKEHFVLQKIAEAEKIEVEDNEIDSEIERIADEYGESPRRVRAQMEKEELLDTLAAQLIERKALNLILESATYEDVPLEQEQGVSSTEAQAAEGEVKDPTAPPPAPPAESETAAPEGA